MRWAFTKAFNRCLRIAVFAGLPLTAVAVAESPLNEIETFFNEYDKSLSELASDPDIVNGSVAAVRQRLASYMERRDALHTLMRINSSGKVINESVRDGKPGRKNRSVARQSWYTTVADNLEPYYGYVKPARGPLMLFWAKPLRVDDKGKVRSGGALLAKIDLADAIQKASRSLDVPFTVLWDGDNLLAHKGGAPDDADAVALTINGIEDLTFRGPPAAVAGASAAAIGDKPKPGPAASPAENTPGESEPGTSLAGNNRMRLVFAVLAGVVVLLIVLIWALVHSSRKNHERLMREIDGTDALPSGSQKTVGPMPGRPDTRQTSQPPSVSARPTERQIPQVPIRPTPTPTPTPQPQAVRSPQPQLRPQTRQYSQQFRPQTRQYSQQVRPQTGQHSQQQLQAQQQAQQPPRSPDTKTLAGATVVTPEMYEKLRQQLKQEISTQLRAQLQDEFEAERRKLNARAQVFHRTVQSHIQELVDQMTEAEGRWNELSTAMKNSAFKLKQALDGLQHGGV
ncbi:MAG: hypothetical protein GF331_09740 [Chitinivibrionales bacterium]|nr:hypothetical protein [Chitinivibrionales bacterium]